MQQFIPRPGEGITAIQVSAETIPELVELGENGRDKFEVTAVTSKSAWFQHPGLEPFGVRFGDWLVCRSDGRWHMLRDEVLRRDFQPVNSDD